jgi:hypothetical protein
MATVAHQIHSHYNPEERKRLERETGQHEEEHLLASSSDLIDAAWQKEPSRAFRTPRLAAPRFVPATISDAPITSCNEKTIGKETLESERQSIAAFYRSVVNTNTTPRASPSPVPRVITPSESTQSAPRPERRTRNNWFIMRALDTQPTKSPTPMSTLADMISRDPPPSPSDKPFTPPVFLSLGPNNRGWAMLQRTGWQEGEAVGLASRARLDRNPPRESSAIMNQDITREEPERKRIRVAEERCKEIQLDEDISEVRKEQFIDLTLSDDGSDDVLVAEAESVKEEYDGFEYPVSAGGSDIPSPRQTSGPLSASPDPGSHTALLTPLPTVLKADRLGIGLKAKSQASTTGGYRVPKKRVTHNDAALVAHVRAAERLRAQKTETGRGKRGFERVRKREESQRRDMMAYMNS